MALVSIVTPCFNSAAFITETIQSVIAQTFRDWELLVVDDLSTDGSFGVVQALASEDKRVRVWRLDTHGGPAKARNEAIRIASGRYIAFVDSDDIWFPQKLEKQINFMQETGANLSYTSIAKISESGKFGEKTVIAPKSVTYRKMLLTDYIACSSAIFDTSTLGKVYMPDILKRQDYGLWLSILKNPIAKARGISEVLVYYRIRQGSVSSNKFRAAIYNWRLYRNIEHLSMLHSIWCFLNYAVRGFFRNV